MKTNNEKIIATNRKAYHEYNILEKWEAGIVLQGQGDLFDVVGTSDSPGGFSSSLHGRQ